MKLRMLGCDAPAGRLRLPPAALPAGLGMALLLMASGLAGGCAAGAAAGCASADALRRKPRIVCCLPARGWGLSLLHVTHASSENFP